MQKPDPQIKAIQLFDISDSNAAVTRGMFVALAMALVVCAASLIFFALSVRSEINSLAETDLEELQQTMIGFDGGVYDFLAETNASHDHGFDHSDAHHLSSLRDSYLQLNEFVAALDEGVMFQYLHDDPAADQALRDLRGFINDYGDIITGDDHHFVDKMDQLHDDAYILPELAQVIKSATEARVAAERVARRQDATSALSYLTYLAIGFVVLVLMAIAALAGLYRASRHMARTEGALRNRVESIVATAQDAVVVTDKSGHIQHFNTAAERLFGFSRDDIASRNAVEVLAAEEGRDPLYARMKHLATEARRTPRAVFDRFIQSAVRVDGAMFPAEVSTSVSRIKNDLLFVHFVRDISARLAAERELKAARDKAMSGEKAKSNFLAVMSHEIRTPLNGLLGTLTLLEDTKLTKTQTQYLENMQRSGQLLREHVDDVLDIARFEAGYQPELVDIDLDALLSEVIENQVHLAAIRNNTVTWNWVGEPSSLMHTDPRLLRQVLINLVGNGVKFTDEGLVSLEAEMHPAPAGQILPVLELRVSDSGPGISGEDQSRIFQDFERVDSSLTRDTNGTGLGLGIARRMTEALGGRIGVTSEVGEGATFWVRIPFTEAKGEVVTLADDGEVFDPSSIVTKHALLVEDNEINRQVMTQMLIADGHTVDQATNGREGVDMAAAQKYDVILMDVSMPVMDGPTAIGLIRDGDGPNRDTEIVVVTAHVMLKEYARFCGLGAAGYLKKPIDRIELRQIMSGVYMWPEDLAEEPMPIDTPEIDAAQLEILIEGLGPEKVAEVLQQFYAEGDALHQTLSGDHADMSTVAEVHKFAGSAAIVGAADLHALLGEFEALANSESPQAAQDLYAVEICRLIAATRAELTDFANDIGL